jgi:hypothetical protein
MTIRSTPLVAIAVLLGACASTQIGSPDQYQLVSMNKVFPYPAEEDPRQVSVVLAQRYASELPGSVVGGALAQTHRTLAGFASAAGAREVESGADADRVLALGVRRWKPAGASSETPSHALVSTFSRYDYASEYAKPVNWFRKSEEEMAGKPGRCTHRAEVELSVQLYELPSSGLPVKSFTLANSGQAKTKSSDASCPYSEAQQKVLFEHTLKQALECLQIPIQNSLAASATITEHRKKADADEHIFRAGLGTSNGGKAGLQVDIYRIQISTTDDGDRSVQEIEIAEGVITDQVADDHSWIRVDLGKAQQPLLKGDLAKLSYRESLVSGVPGFGACHRILSEE